MASVQPGDHCPFLNRADSRCGENFSIERLDHAYQYCFDRYTTCAIYHELLVERQVRRVSANATNLTNPPLVQVSLNKAALRSKQPSRVTLVRAA